MGTTLQSISALMQKTTINDHEEFIKACNSVLKKSRNDVDAQHIKTIALIKLDRFEDAIRVIEEGGDALKKILPLEWSYALYKSGRLDEATAIAASAGSERGAKHVEAQATYRAECFDRTGKIYEDLLSNERASTEELTDLQINITATEAQRLWAEQNNSIGSLVPKSENLDIFEAVYNVACQHIAKGHYEKAHALLKRSKALCEASDELSPDDKKAELLPIIIQEVYLCLQQRKLEEADTLIREINFADITEPSTKIIAENLALLTTRRNANPYLKYKFFNSTSRPTDNDKFFFYQNDILCRNAYIIDLMVQKFDGVSRSTLKTLSQHRSPSLSPDINSLAVFNAAAHTHGTVSKSAIKKTSSLVETRPHDLGLILLLTQLHVVDGNINAAISTLEDYSNRVEEVSNDSSLMVRFSPGLVNILVTLYRTQGRKHRINSELSKAAKYWQKKSPSCQPIPLLRAAAISLFNSHDPSDISTAAEIFGRLHSTDDTDRIATAGFVASHAITSPDLVESSVKTLLPVQELIAGVDVAGLEEAGVQLPASTGVSALKQGQKRRAPDAVRKNKRVRKAKNMDPNEKVDLERWLPLRDRSSYRPRGKKGKQKAADRTQGGVVNEKTEDGNGSSTPAKSSSQVISGGGGARKKKGKGKK
ncbi:Signal recognition particle subunit SRP72 [Microsporum audouinii]